MSDDANRDLLASLQLDPAQPTPLYHQLYLGIRALVRSGEIAPGSLLPGELHLSSMFNVSRITVKRALAELAADGLLDRQRGRGTLVTSNAPLQVVKGSSDSLLDSLRQMGLETEIEILDVAEIAADATVAGLLEIATGDPVQRAVRRRKIQGDPFSCLITYIPAAIAGRYSVADLATTSLLTLLERAGAAAVAADQWISAVAAPPAIAVALDVANGSPLLKVDRVMRDATGRPVQLIHSHYRSDRFQYHFTASEHRSLADD